MAMTLRLSDEAAVALRARADAEGRSMQEVLRSALQEYLDRRERRASIDAILDVQLPRYADALERLGQ